MLFMVIIKHIIRQHIRLQELLVKFIINIIKYIIIIMVIIMQFKLLLFINKMAMLFNFINIEDIKFIRLVIINIQEFNK